MVTAAMRLKDAYSLEGRPLVELCVEPAGLCGRCTGVAVPLRVVPSSFNLMAAVTICSDFGAQQNKV